MPLSPELDCAERAARAAGERLAHLMTEQKLVLSETANDIKLQADRDAEAIVLDGLAATNLPVLAEESGEHSGIDTNGTYWVVDPLDGTFNFSRGVPMCCVSIALMRDGEPHGGVIYDFNRGECFTGEVGVGAWLDGTPMRVSSIDASSRGVIAFGFPKRRTWESAEMQVFAETLVRFKKVRLFGSAAIAAAYVACGRVDAYIEKDMMLWDIAGGAALVKAAGGVAELSESVPPAPWRCSVRMAGNPAVWTN